MLEHTLLHLPGIGPKTEFKLWENGILTWEDFEHAVRRRHIPVSDTGLSRLLDCLTASRRALETGDLTYFARRLPAREHYRLVLARPHRTVFLDIETTGLSQHYHETTLIGAWRDGNYQFYLKGEDPRPLHALLRDADCLVTFNGTRFDLPFLRTHHPSLILPPLHLDLMYLARRAGLSGGQKAIENALGFLRPEAIRSTRGEEAPALWYAYTYGDLEAGHKLVAYNSCDIDGMRFILDTVVARLMMEYPPAIVYPSMRFSESNNAVGSAPGTVRIGRYKGRRGPKARFEDLGFTRELERLRVVGIDLTGSARRASGWCLLVGQLAETSLLHSDDEIVRSTLDAQPDLVSIDSPLSLPRGRQHAGDDDPARQTHGIMRECERTLKRRGVNVYPCLIESMQKLTARGITLADTLRSHGVPVIESYPGGAQDIIGLPRKGDSLDMLKRGLQEFGTEGQYLTTHVTHDEIDAITSALVGVFFWSGHFEALGTPEEDYLIVPNLGGSPEEWWCKRLIIGISGSIASGKTTAARFLERTEGFAYGRYSEVLADVLKERGETPNRTTLQALGQQVNETLGQRWLCRKLVERMPQDVDIVVDGLRFPEDRAFLIEAFGPGFFQLHVEAPLAVRRDRYIAGGFTLDEFRLASKHPVERQIPALSRLANHMVQNTAGDTAFLEAVQSIAYEQRQRITSLFEREERDADAVISYNQLS